MTTKRDLVKAALGELGMGDYVFDATPEEFEDGRKRLDRIAAQWTAQTINVGYLPTAGLDDDAGIPDTAENAFVLALAVNWAKTFGKQMSADLKAEAAAAWNALYTSMALRPIVPVPASMPYGSGQRPSSLGAQYFPENDGTVEGLDATGT